MRFAKNLSEGITREGLCWLPVLVQVTSYRQHVNTTEFDSLSDNCVGWINAVSSTGQHSCLSAVIRISPRPFQHQQPVVQLGLLRDEPTAIRLRNDFA